MTSPQQPNETQTTNEPDEEAALDHGIEESFPASDPVSIVCLPPNEERFAEAMRAAEAAQARAAGSATPQSRIGSGPWRVAGAALAGFALLAGLLLWRVR